MSVQGALDQRVSDLVAQGVAAVRAEAADLVAALEARLAVLEQHLEVKTLTIQGSAASEGEPLPDADSTEKTGPARRPRTPRKTAES